MSLLLQALQKAARTRESAASDQEPAREPSIAESQPEGWQDARPETLSLEEPVLFEPTSAAAQSETSHTTGSSGAPPAPTEPTFDLEADADLDFDPDPNPLPLRKSDSSLRSVRSLNATVDSGSSAHAAQILRASEARSTGLLDWLRDRPVHAFAAMAGVFLLGYLGYVYVQIAHPGWLRGNFGTKVVQANKSPPPAPPPTAAAPTAPPAPAVTGLPTAGAGAAPAMVTPSPAPTGASADGAPSPSSSAPTGASAGGAALPSVTSVESAGTPPAKVALSNKPPATRKPRPPRTVVPIAPQAQTSMPDVPVDPLADNVDVRRKDPLPAAPAQSLTDAWEALQRGRLDQAQALYETVLAAEPQNVDALLGLGAIAAQRGATDAALRFFGRALELEPRNSAAQAGLIALVGQADPQLSETRLKHLISTEPSGSLYFALGNLYARQGLWAQAQQAYFQALQLQPDSADFAYNLAVALEHLGQPKLALSYYRKAMELFALKGAANFDTTRVQDRIGQLTARLSSQ
jgi:Tfp pilus assembly protein PilF